MDGKRIRILLKEIKNFSNDSLATTITVVVLHTYPGRYVCKFLTSPGFSDEERGKPLAKLRSRTHTSWCLKKFDL